MTKISPKQDCPLPTPAGKRANPPKASHGFRSEVSWDQGRGSQPYSNQGPEESREPNLGNEFDGGDQGEHAGVSREQLKAVKGLPGTDPSRPSKP